MIRRWIQVLVVIVIAIVVIGLLLPGVSRVKNADASVRCKNQLKQLVLATHNYASYHGDKLPDALKTGEKAPPAGPPRFMSTHVLLLPFMERDNILMLGTRMTGPLAVKGGVDWNVGYDDPIGGGKTVRTTPIKPYMCSRDPGMDSDGSLTVDPAWAGTSYASNARLFGQVTASPPEWKCKYKISDIPDGASNTIFFVEKGASCEQGIVRGMKWATWDAPDTKQWHCTVGFPMGDWDQPPMILPTSQTCRAYSANSYHAGGTLAGMGDGSVKFMAADLTSGTWVKALDPADGEALGPDW